MPINSKTLFASFIALAFAFTGLSRNADEISPLLIGSEVPNVSVTDKDGNKVQLSSIIGEQGTIIVFYRGGWCPYCSRHMQELAQVESELLKLGYQIIAISPESPELVKEASEKNPGNYHLYSDSSFEAADAFGVSFDLPKEMAEHIKEVKNIDLTRLPVPAVFISTPSKHISFQYADPNFRFRLPGDLLLAAAKSSKRFHQKD